LRDISSELNGEIVSSIVTRLVTRYDGRLLDKILWDTSAYDNNSCVTRLLGNLGTFVNIPHMVYD
jgi:hypothetical protein